MNKYSQGDEQQHILAACASIQAGRFLDIGAFNARDLSNTRALYELGWSGVLVEPSPEPFLGLLKEYGNDPQVTLVNAAVGVTGQLVRFRATADALTTSSDKNYEIWKEAGGFYGSFFSRAVQVEELYRTFGSFDFISIDTEGTSVDVFKCVLASFTTALPKCICVEHDGMDAECDRFAAERGYRRTYFSGENVVYAK